MAVVTIGVFFLVICSSFFHALWNFFARSIKGNLGVLFFGFFVAAFCLSPVVLFINLVKPSFITVHWDPKSVIFIFLSAVAHALYFWFLGSAYKYGEISVVYPVARGTGIGVTSLVAYFVLGEAIQWPLGWIGIWSIISGVLFLGLGKHIRNLFSKSVYSKVEVETKEPILEKNEDGMMEDEGQQDAKNEEKEGEIELDEIIEVQEDVLETKDLPSLDITSQDPSFWRTFVLAISVGLSIAFYSISDKLGVDTMDPITYIFLMYICTGILSSPYMWWRHREECKQSLQQLKKYVVLVGVISCGAYLAILFAFQLSPASYIVAIREISVVIGSLLGLFILKEEFNWMKVLGIILIVSGLVMVKLA